MAGHSIGTTHYRRRLDGLVGGSNLSKKIDVVLAAAYKDKNVSVEQYKGLRIYANNKTNK